jgi:hypothetical protein
VWDNPPVEREELQAALAARRELGRDYEPEVVDSFLERVERRLAERGRPPQHGQHEPPSLALPVASIAMGIPITAIAGGTAGISGIVVAWAGIVGVNLAHALSGRRR